MKIWDVIKELHENNNLRFKNKAADISVTASTINPNNIIFVDVVTGRRIIIDCLDISDEWELVLEEVDFLTAFKALVEKGQTIQSVDSDGEVYCRFEPVNPHYFDEYEIKNCKWYIEG